MSDIHILDKAVNNKTVNCIFHLSIPSTNNAVGIQWNVAVQRHLNQEPQMSWNDSTENANIVAGDILEHAETVRYSTVNLTNTQRLAEVEAAYNNRKTDLLTELQARLDFFGKEV